MVEWTKENVLEFIKGCREDKGVPMFRTKFGGLELEGVIGVCWGGEGLYPDHIKFEDVPDEDKRFLEQGFNDWERLLMKWNEVNLLKELREIGVVFGKG